MPTQSLSDQPKRHFRIDPEHQLLDMMQKAVARLQGANIQIQLHNESVVLTGTVQCWHEKQFVQESLRRLSGNRTISNGLQVVGA